MVLLIATSRGRSFDLTGIGYEKKERVRVGLKRNTWQIEVCGERKDVTLKERLAVTTLFVYAEDRVLNDER